MSQSTSLHASLDWAPNSSLHVVSFYSLSVEDVLFLIEGDHLGMIVTSDTFTPFLVISSKPFDASVLGLSDTLSVLHLTVSVDAPDLFLHTVNKLVGVGLSILVFNLKPVSSHLDSIITKSGPFQGLNTSMI